MQTDLDINSQFLLACTNLEENALKNWWGAGLESRIDNWAAFLILAESQGMAPLLYRNIKKNGIDIPEEALQNLKALVLRHRLINQVREQVLSELFTRCEQEQIPILAVKGAALAYLLYPSPGLRPMRDIDLLIHPEDIERLKMIFKQMEFNWGDKEENKHRHYPPFNKRVDGFNISIEVHTALFQTPERKTWFQIDDLSRPPLEFHLGERGIARTLNHEDMLFHLCQQTFRQGFGLELLKTIHLADIINYSERFQDQIDWALIHERYPVVIHVLAGLGEMIPLSPSLRKCARIPQGKPYARMGEGYLGWPAVPISHRRARPWQILRKTLFPSPWWLNMRYGSTRKSGTLRLWGSHLWNLCRCIYARLTGTLYNQ